VRAYYYIRSRGRQVGGPYGNIAGLAKGIRRAETRGIPRSDMTALKLVGGHWHPLAVDEAEALVAALD
jgi:hypothetical protein